MDTAGRCTSGCPHDQGLRQRAVETGGSGEMLTSPGEGGRPLHRRLSNMGRHNYLGGEPLILSPQLPLCSLRGPPKVAMVAGMVAAMG